MAKAPQAKEPVQEDLLKEIDLKAEEVKPEGEVEVEVEKPEEEVEDPSIALQKQIEALRKSEEIQKGRAERFRQEAEEARQASQAHAAEVGKSRKEILQSQFDSVSTALAASQSEVESAKRDIRSAKANGEVEAEIEAFERLSRAQANVANLENGKIELESRLKAPDPEPQTNQPPPMPARIQRWVNKNPDIFKNDRTFSKVKAYHYEITEDEGIEFDSDDYIVRMEEKMGMREAEKEEAEVVPLKPKPKQPVSVSAPVSREAPSTPDGDRGGVVRLTQEQREMAAVAGVTEKVYAENLVKMRKMKANGSYGG